MIPKDRRFAHLERKVGAFVLLTLVGIAAVVAFIGIERGVFTKKYSLHFTVDKGTGFAVGMPVKLSGFYIGRLEKLALTDQARVNVTIVIEKKYSKWIRRDSSVKLVKEGMIGDSIIEMKVGNPASTELRDGEAIAYEPSPTLDDLVADVKAQVLPVLDQLKGMVAYMDDPKGDVKQTIANVRELTAGLPETRAKVDGLIVSVKDEIVTVRGDVEKILTSVDGLLATVDERVKKVNPIVESAASIASTAEKRLPPMLDEVEKSLKEVRATLEKVRVMVDESSGDVPGLLSNTVKLTENGNDIAESVKKTWPISSNVPPPVPVLVPGESYERVTPKAGGGDGK